jgi:PTS system mannose-specific IIB component
VTIAIVIGTHGWAAEQLLKTAEMLLGEQENIGWIDFVPGENAETLIEKYTAQLEKLDTSSGVLFLVDTWGGSPFNAASRIVVDKEHHEVVAGVNIPMLVETLMARDDNPGFDELVALAVETGREGVKALKAQPVAKPAPAAAAPKAATPARPMGPNDYMVIGLARIDDRLIHGQVATRWTKETNVQRIIVVSDEVAADTVRKTLLTQVAPPGVTAHVVDVAKMIRVYNNPKYAGERIMLLSVVHHGHARRYALAHHRAGGEGAVGVNPFSVLRAAWQDLTSGRVVSGGSTAHQRGQTCGGA